MKQKYGKFYARWTAPDGKRHEKACDTKRAAMQHQREMQAERARKKAPATAQTPAQSAPHGRARQKTAHAASSPKR